LLFQLFSLSLHEISKPKIIDMTKMKKLLFTGCLLAMTTIPAWAQAGTKIEAEKTVEGALH